jgi:hypothetical protein
MRKVGINPEKAANTDLAQGLIPIRQHPEMTARKSAMTRRKKLE